MGVKLVSASAGSVEIVAPTTASNYTATMPAGTGNVVVNGINSSIVSGTAVNAATGSPTSVDFTSIPSWVKRITVMFSGVSTNATGTSNIIVQLGVSNTAVTSGYVGAFSLLGAITIATGTSNTSGFVITQMPATAATWSGQMVITNITGNTWVSSSSCARTDNGTMVVQSGVNPLSGTVTNLRVTTVNGTDTFDAGSINILYE